MFLLGTGLGSDVLLAAGVMVVEEELLLATLAHVTMADSATASLPPFTKDTCSGK